VAGCAGTSATGSGCGAGVTGTLPLPPCAPPLAPGVAADREVAQLDVAGGRDADALPGPPDAAPPVPLPLAPELDEVPSVPPVLLSDSTWLPGDL